MGKKIFRLHNNGTTEGTGWFNSKPLNSEQLNSIRTNGKEVATSIPTPYATIDLVKSAFNWVAKNDLKGTTAQHNLVSYALDVGQLFFAYPRFKDKLRIVAYNPLDRFNELKTKNEGQKKFAQTLELFWQQDKAYNFDKTNRLYFVLNKGTNEILGSTSPSTIFMASPDVRYASKNLDIQIANHKLFNDKFTPLHERDKSFIIYLYALSKQPHFADYFEEFYQYLDKVKLELPDDVIQMVTELTSTGIDQYDPCPVLNNSGDPCEVLGYNLHVQGEQKVKSDFEIKPDYNIKEVLPLVLPQYPFTKEWNYVSGVIWDENTRTPEKNEKSPEESKLPVQNIPHYWLTIGNFLEDKIIELPYNIDSSKFITCGSEKYLLPLSPTYFKYFNHENVDKQLSIKERSGGNVDVELKISVKKGEIIFKKRYSLADKNIETLDIHLAIFPFLKSEEFDITHNIGVLDYRDEKSNSIELFEIKGGKKIDSKPPIVRNPGNQGELVSMYFNTNIQPEVIGVITKKCCSSLIPKFKTSNTFSKVNFAVDFGTTNTHIEYNKEGEVPKAFESTKSNPLWASILDYNDTSINPILLENEKTFEQEMFPKIISGNSDVNFPLRTALIYNSNIDFNRNVEIIREVNNYLLLDEVPLTLDYLKLKTDIKWSNYSDTAEEKKVESYLEFLTILIYYKTIEIGGNPNNTYINWFYPVSMDDGEREVFFKLWKKIFAKVFNTTSLDNINGLPESIGPYLYYKSSVAGLSLSIDIGGGSSDLAVFDEQNKNPKLISSFKFAGNSIFGDGYPTKELANNSDRNGFVQMFKDDAINAVGDNDKILKDILQVKKNSADFSSYLFALEQKDSNNFSYSNLIRKNKNLKLSIFIFYGAIAYYSAKLLKKSNVNEIPKYLLLSGTASKTSSILDPSEELNNLSYLFQFMFEKIYKIKSKENLQIILSPIPKEVTCKGALKAEIDDDIKDIPIKYWIGGQSESVWGKSLDRDKNFNEIPDYKELNSKSKYKDEIEDSLKEFYNLLDLYVSEVNIKSKYLLDSSSYNVFTKIRERDIKDFITKGINAFYKKDDSKIEESLFFYPLIGILNRLSYNISQINKE